MTATADVLTPDAVAFLDGSAARVRRTSHRRAGAACGAGRPARRRPAPGLPGRDGGRPRGRLADRAVSRRDRGPPGRDHRPGRPQDGDQRPQLGRARVHGRLRGLELAHLGELHRRTAEPHRCSRSHDRARYRREALPLARRGRRAVRATARLAPGRAALRGRRQPDVRRRSSTSACTSSAITRATGRYLYLPKLESHLEARLWNDVFAWTQDGSGCSRDDQGDRPDRDDPRGVRDGRDPVRAARPLGRPECRSLGLHLQRHQEARSPARVRAAGPRRRDDGRAVHARLLRAARQDLPSPRRVRDGRHGRLHPVPPRRRGERGRAREGRARTRSARRPRASTGRGSPIPISCRSPRGRSTRCSATARTRSTASATTSTSARPICWPSRRRPGERTEEGLRNNVSVGIQYLAAWLQGSGAVAIYNLMEDAATAEICRSQVWQWLHHGRITADQVRRITDEEVAKLGDGYEDARAIFEAIATRDRLRRVPHAARVRAADGNGGLRLRPATGRRRAVRCRPGRARVEAAGPLASWTQYEVSIRPHQCQRWLQRARRRTIRSRCAAPRAMPRRC